MKILETQSATLTNYEVLTHLQALQVRYAAQDAEDEKRHDDLIAGHQRAAEAQGHEFQAQDFKREPRASNLETIMKELTEYLTSPNSPLAPPAHYRDESIRELMTKLARFDLTKAELLMIFNLRPKDAGALDPIIEEAENRFSEVELEQILRTIREVLGGEEEGMDGVEYDEQNGAHGDDAMNGTNG